VATAQMFATNLFELGNEMEVKPNPNTGKLAQGASPDLGTQEDDLTMTPMTSILTQLLHRSLCEGATRRGFCAQSGMAL
jgi:hypothetical protein